MPKYRRYVKENVHDEAKRRLRLIFDAFDSVVVSFSGGKDSLVALHLTREVAAERGIQRVSAVFRDEEVIPFAVIEFVDHYRKIPWVDLQWWAVPLKSNKFVLGDVQDYVQWDPAREWIRPKPEWALTERDLGIPEGAVTSQFTADEIIARQFPGKVCIVTGMRADESLLRLRSVVNKEHEPWVCNSSSKRAMLGRPLYDWGEQDVFKAIYDRGLSYCALYDAQVWSRSKRRVSTAIHMESAKNMGVYRALDPELYERIIAIWPDMALQDRYYRQLAPPSEKYERFGQSWEGVDEYIATTITQPRERAVAREFVVKARKLARAAPLSYTPGGVLEQIRRHGGRRDPQATHTKSPLRPERSQS